MKNPIVNQNINLPIHSPILLISNEPWGDVWYSKQHYANELAKLGFKVYFLNPAKNIDRLSYFNLMFSEEIFNENIKILSYNNVPFFRLVNQVLLNFKLNYYFKTKELIIWNFDPFRFFFIKNLNYKTYIYHVVDKYLHLATDKKIAKISDLLIIVTPTFLQDYNNQKNKIIQISHGIAIDDIIIEGEKNPILLNNYILFIGTFNIGVDYELLIEIASKLKDKVLLLIGPKDSNLSLKSIELFNRLLQYENVNYIGVVHSKNLKYYVKNSKVCIIPYLISHSFRAQTLKALTYLTQKKPIVCIPLKDLEKFENKFIFFGKNHQDFLNQISAIYHGTHEIDTSAIDDYIESHLYPVLIGKVFDQLNNLRTQEK